MLSFKQCIHFGRCGGCATQELPYEEELLNKEKFINDLFHPFSLPISSIISTQSPWHYRNKMEFSFSQSKEGERFLGLMMKKGRGKVLSLQECLISSPWFITVLHAVSKWWHTTDLCAYYPPLDRGSLRTLTLRHGLRTDEKMVILTISGHPHYALRDPHLMTFVESVLQVGAIDSLILRKQIIAKKVPTRFEEVVLYGKDHIQEKLSRADGHPLTFKIRPSSFFQPNTKGAEIIYQESMKLACLQPNDIVFDLYCGTGSLGIFAADSVKQVVGIEQNAEAIKDGRDNLFLNQISNVDFFEGDVADSMPTSIKPTLLFVDPPRAGLSQKALQIIQELSAKKIIYISCNPKSQVENLKELQKFGYQLCTIQPVDQFPHTPHVENIVELASTL